MSHDPWSLHASLSCPACHVTGKVVTCEDYDAEPPYVCCDCGSSWVDTGSYADESLKECRTNMMRLVEGRPYEAPPPKPHDPNARHINASAYDSVLKDYYQRPASGPAIGDLVKRAKSIAESWHSHTDTWSLGDWMDRAAKLGEMPDGDDTE